MAGCVFVAIAASMHSANGFNANGEWAATATDTDREEGSGGSPLTLTWSIVPDGTPIPSSNNAPSNLFATFDALIGSGVGSDDPRPWVTLFQQSFDRWAAVSGVQFVHEPNDDGAAHGESLGLLGTRGDIRIGGATIDGNGGTFGQTGFVPNADITLDTGDSARFGDASNNHFSLRQTLMHEIGHSIGLGHNQALGAFVLMNPFAQMLFDGPQFDDIRGAHHLFGDPYEKLSPEGNNTPITATTLGTLTAGSTASIGADVQYSTSALSPLDIDFASISNSDDTDYWSFGVEGHVLLNVELTPGGFLYQERISNGQSYSPMDARQQNDLTIALFSLENGVTELIAMANDFGLGGSEALLDTPLEAGEYVLKVSGSNSEVQLYELALNVVSNPIISTIAGDFNSDGTVNLADYTLWRDRLNSTEPLANAPASPALVDAADYQTWRGGYGTTAPVVATTSIAEPTAQMTAMAVLAIGLGGLSRQRHGRP